MIWIYYLCYAQESFPEQSIPAEMLSMGRVSHCIFFFINKTHPATIAYGARTNLLHFPLFSLWPVFLPERMINFGKAFLLLALPMTWVVAQQFQSDSEDIMNVAAGGTGAS